MDNVAEKLEKSFKITKLSVLLNFMEKKEYLLLMFLIDYYCMNGDDVIEMVIPLSFIKKNLGSKTDTRTIKTALEKLQKKGIIRFYQSGYFKSFQLKKTLEFLDEIIKLTKELNKDNSNPANAEVEKCNTNLTALFNKLSKPYQEYLKIILSITFLSPNNEISIEIFEDEIEKLENMKKLISDKNGNPRREKHFVISFIDNPDSIIYTFLQDYKLDPNKDLMAPLIFAFNDLPVNELLVLLFIIELFNFFLEACYLTKDMLMLNKLLDSTITISRDLLAEVLGYDISFINKTLLSLEDINKTSRSLENKRGKLIKIIPGIENVDIKIYFDSIEKIIDVKMKELDKLILFYGSLEGFSLRPQNNKVDKKIDY